MGVIVHDDVSSWWIWNNDLGLVLGMLKPLGSASWALMLADAYQECGIWRMCVVQM